MKIHSILLSLYIAQINAQAFGSKCTTHVERPPCKSKDPINCITIDDIFESTRIRTFGEQEKGNCNNGLVCHNNICKFDTGHKCSKNSDCGQHNNICFRGKCEPKGGLGQPCVKLLECYHALICLDMKNGKGHCGNRRYLAVGSKCKSEVECEFGCINGKCDKKWDGKCTNASDCKSGELCFTNGKCCPANSPDDSICVNS